MGAPHETDLQFITLVSPSVLWPSGFWDPAGKNTSLHSCDLIQSLCSGRCLLHSVIHQLQATDSPSFRKPPDCGLLLVSLLLFTVWLWLGPILYSFTVNFSGIWKKKVGGCQDSVHPSELELFYLLKQNALQSGFSCPLSIQGKNHSVVLQYISLQSLQAVKSISSQTVIVLNSCDYSFHFLPSLLPYCHSHGAALNYTLFF